MEDYKILQYHNTKEVTKSSILGFFIGLAIIVPGISGSTIAIIFQLYEKLLYAVGQLFKRFKICFLFLLPILLGAGIGFVLGFFTIQSLLKLFPFAVMAFFGGLMIGSFPAITEEIKNEKLTKSKIALFFLGLIIPITISLVSTFSTKRIKSFEDIQFYHYILFLCLGYIISITQIVPGLSASALLMAFGYFRPLLESVSISYIQSNPSILGIYLCLIIGFSIGLISFSRFLIQVLNKHRKLTFFMIVGLSLGSILSIFFNPDIYEVYQSWFLGNMSFGLDLGLGVFLLIAGILLGLTFLKYEKTKS